MSIYSSTKESTPVQRNKENNNSNNSNNFTESNETMKTFNLLNKKREEEEEEDLYKLKGKELENFDKEKEKINSLVIKYSRHYNFEKIISDYMLNCLLFLYRNGLFTVREGLNSKCVSAIAINYALQKNKDSLIPIEDLCEYFNIEKDKLIEKAKKYYFYIMERSGLAIYLNDLYLEVKKIEKNMGIPKIMYLKEFLTIIQIYIEENVFKREDIFEYYSINNFACALILFEIKLFKISFCSDSSALKTNYKNYSTETKEEENKLINYISTKTGFASTKPRHFIYIYKKMVKYRNFLNKNEEYKNKLINFN